MKKRKNIPDWKKKNIPDWPPIVVAVDGHNGNFAETENEPKTKQDIRNSQKENHNQLMRSKRCSKTRLRFHGKYSWHLISSTQTSTSWTLPIMTPNPNVPIPNSKCDKDNYENQWNLLISISSSLSSSSSELWTWKIQITWQYYKCQRQWQSERELMQFSDRAFAVTSSFDSKGLTPKKRKVKHSKYQRRHSFQTSM